MFKPLLNESTRNVIDFWESKLDCSDCKNQWMIKQNKQTQILFPSCLGSNNKLFDEEIKNQLNLKCE